MPVNGTSKTNDISLSLEIGKRIWLAEQNQGLYIEPQAQVTFGYQFDDVNARNHSFRGNWWENGIGLSITLISIIMLVLK